jgi:hypothetical protein
VFDFLLHMFLREKENGLTQAKLARRIGKSPEVINRWLGSPTNLTLDSVSDLLIGIAGEELVPQSASVLGRVERNYAALDWAIGHREQEPPRQDEEAKQKEVMPISARDAGGHLMKRGLFDSGNVISQEALGVRSQTRGALRGQLAA